MSPDVFVTYLPGQSTLLAAAVGTPTSASHKMGIGPEKFPG